MLCCALLCLRYAAKQCMASLNARPARPLSAALPVRVSGVRRRRRVCACAVANPAGVKRTPFGARPRTRLARKAAGSHGAGAVAQARARTRARRRGSSWRWAASVCRRMHLLPAARTRAAWPSACTTPSCATARCAARCVAGRPRGRGVEKARVWCPGTRRAPPCHVKRVPSCPAAIGCCECGDRVI